VTNNLEPLDGVIISILEDATRDPRRLGLEEIGFGGPLSLEARAWGASLCEFQLQKDSPAKAYSRSRIGFKFAHVPSAFRRRTHGASPASKSGTKSIWGAECIRTSFEPGTPSRTNGPVMV
jgi:hypothetical protein